MDKMNILEQRVREIIIVPKTAEEEVKFDWRFNGGLEMLTRHIKQDNIPISSVTVGVAADFIARYLYGYYDYESRRDYGPRKIN